MPITARDILQEALKQGMLDAGTARACVDEMKAASGQRKFADVLREVGGLNNAQIKGLMTSLENGGAEPVKAPPRRPRRMAPPPPPSSSKLPLILGLVVLLAAGGVAAWYFGFRKPGDTGPQPPSAPPPPPPVVAPPPPPVTPAGSGDFARVKGEADVQVTLKHLGDAVKMWDELIPRLEAAPGNDDLVRESRKLRQKILDDVQTDFTSTLNTVQELLDEKKFDHAHLELARFLRYGLPDIAKPAWAKIDEIAASETSYINQGSGDMEEARKAREKIDAKYREPDKVRFEIWTKLREHDFTAARAAADNSPFGELQVLALLVKAAEELDEKTAESLKGRTGEGLVLEFEKGDDKEIGTLKAVAGETLTVEIDGKSESRLTQKLTWKQKGELTASPLHAGAAFFLGRDMTLAREKWQAAPGGGEILQALEDSPLAAGFERSYLLRDAKAAADDEDWKKARKLYTLLWLTPAGEERYRLEDLRSRAGCWFRLGQYATALLDILQLIEMDDLSKDTLGFLGAIYSRQALLEPATVAVERAYAKHKDDALLYNHMLALYLAAHRWADIDALLAAPPEKASEHNPYDKVRRLREAKDKVFPTKPAVVEKGSYIVETDLGDARAAEIADFMVARYAEYSRGFPFQKNESLKFIVKVFKVRADFDRYVELTYADRPAGGGDILQGFFSPLTSELVTYDYNDLNETLRHEGFHQFLDYFLPGAPKWFNEGFASYFETSTVDQPVLNVSRMREAKKGFATTKITSFRQLTDDSNWSAAESQALMYGQSWSFIYYLIHIGRRDCLDRYFRMMMRGQDWGKAYSFVFSESGGLINRSDVESDWKKWVAEWKAP